MIQIVQGKPFIRPCRSIPPDGNEFGDALASISTFYEPLTKMLPLAGSTALLPSRPGGDPADTLLGMLERSTANRFFDGCLAAEVDLSHINWVLTANSLTKLSAPLLSRVDVVEVQGPGPEHAEVVLASLWRDVARDAGLPPSDLPRLEAAAETLLLRLFRNTRSVRRLRRSIETVVAVSARHARRAVN